MKTVVIYHKNCFDGICSAWVVHRAKGAGQIYIPMNYSDPIGTMRFDRESEVIMVDISFKPDVLQELAFRVKSLLIIDHHKTAEANLRNFKMENVKIIFDMNESGASLAWKHFFPNFEVPRLVKYIKDRDLWKFEEPNSEIINSYIQSFPMDIIEYEQLYHTLRTDTGMLEANLGGQAINRYKDTMVKAMCLNAVSQQIGDHYVPVVNASILFSEVGHELCKQHPDLPFAAYYFDRRKDGVRQWGLRSIGDFDVSEVAKKFGGGGHKNAAGFEEKLNART